MCPSGTIFGGWLRSFLTSRDVQDCDAAPTKNSCFYINFQPITLYVALFTGCSTTVHALVRAGEEGEIRR